MRIVEKTIIQQDIYYDQPGEGPEGSPYRVGQEVATRSGSLRPYGKVVEIWVAPYRNTFQLKLESGWGCHPESEIVEITKPYSNDQTKKAGEEGAESIVAGVDVSNCWYGSIPTRKKR